MLTWWCWISQLPLLPLGLNQLQFLSVQRSTIDEMWLPDLLLSQPWATTAWSDALASTVKVIEAALLTPSACTNSRQWDSLHEHWEWLWNPAKDEGCQIPAVSLSSADTSILSPTVHLHTQWFYMSKDPNDREAPGIFCFLLKGQYVLVLTKQIFSRLTPLSQHGSAWDEPEIVDVMGWNNLELCPSLLKC